MAGGISVQEVREAVLPAATVLVGGRTGLHRALVKRAT